MKRKPIKFERINDDYTPSCSSYDSKYIEHALIGVVKVMLLIILITGAWNVAVNKIQLNENLYTQCTNSCAKTGSHVVEANYGQAQCIANCNTFYTRIIGGLK